MRRNRTTTSVAFAAVVFALVAGCGGASEPTFLPGAASTGSSTPLSGLVPLRGDGFSIGLPAIPARKQQLVAQAGGPPLPFVIYTVKDHLGGAFTVTRFPYSASALPDLGRAIAGAAALVGGDVKENRPTVFMGYHAAYGRFLVTLEGRPLTVFALALKVGRIVVQIQYLASGADLRVPPPIFDEVINSFAAAP